MNIKIFKGFEDMYPEKVEGTDSWYYSQWTPCSEAYEVPYFKNQYPGTRLCFFEYPSGRVFEPIKQEKNVFLERPVYDYRDNSFGIIRYDFNKEIVQVITFEPESSRVKVITEIDFYKAGDMINLRLVTSPFTLVKYDVQNDRVDFLWPNQMHIKCEENETLYYQNEGKLYLTKWIEIQIIEKK